jgi:hypothetical protein
MYERRMKHMIENEFCRIALAQGLLPTVPITTLWDATHPVPERDPGPLRGTFAPADNPAMVEQHAPNA